MELPKWVCNACHVRNQRSSTRFQIAVNILGCWGACWVLTSRALPYTLPQELLVGVDPLPGARELGGMAGQQLPVRRRKLPEVVLPARHLPGRLILVLPERCQDPGARSHNALSLRAIHTLGHQGSRA